MLNFLSENIMYIFMIMLVITLIVSVGPLKETIWPLCKWFFHKVYVAIVYVSTVVSNAHKIYFKNFQPRVKVLPSNSGDLQQTKRK